MTFSPTSRQVVLYERFDETSYATEEEVQEYAKRIGIDVEKESHLLPICRECLMQPLPNHWLPCYDTDQPDNIYYFNTRTKRAQWVHPLEDSHKNLISKARGDLTSSTDQFDEDSRTTAREDLKSFEEAAPSFSLRSSEMIPPPKPRILEPRPLLQPPRGALRKPPQSLGPLKTAMPASVSKLETKKVSFDDIEVKIRPNSSDIRNRRNIGPLELRHLSKQGIMTTNQGHGTLRDDGYGTESVTTQSNAPLTLTGGGAAFLKKAVKSDAEPQEKMTSVAVEKDKKVLDHAEKENMKISPFHLEKELKVNFEIPSSDDASSRKGSLGDTKQIEIDFEDLKIDLDPKLVPNSEVKTVNEAVKASQLTRQSSTDMFKNFKKSINIVLNEKVSEEDSVEDKKSENLIDLSDLESIISNAEDSHNDVDAKLPVTSSEIGQMGLKKVEIMTSQPSPKINVTKSVPSVEEILKVNQSVTPSPKETIVDRTKVEETIEVDGDIIRAKTTLDTAKAEKLKALESDYNKWVKNTEKKFRDKEATSYNSLKEKYEDWKKNEENGLIKEMGERCSEELQGKIKALRNQLLKEEQEAIETLRTTLAMQAHERLDKLKAEVEAREEKELAELRKTLEASLIEKKDELYKKHQEEMTRLERSLDSILAEQRKQRQQELEKARADEAALSAMRAQLKDAFLEQKTILQQEHEMALHKLKQQHEVELFHAGHAKPYDLSPSPRLTVPPPAQSSPQSPGSSSDPRVYEKLRCEKRLLEDKYKCLKEKYIRLKTDVKRTLEKRGKKKEAPAVAGGQETGRSLASQAMHNKIGKSNELSLPLDNMNQNVSADEETGDVSKNEQSELSLGKGRGTVSAGMMEGGSSADENEDRAKARRRRLIFSKLKASSTSKINSLHRVRDKDDGVSPVENLRRQLKKLEELEDQFPVATHTDTYLRYPFTDSIPTSTPHFASSELEFFKHRIHLERDSVRRAKEFLKAQKKCYENRQRELQHRLLDGPSSKSLLDKIHQEERELTEMEVSVHRTRALLGEKIIRLRHLEQSLRRATPEKRSHNSGRDDATLSDLSSHSDSSGFSSTHHNSEPLGPRLVIDKSKRLQPSMQEPSEIIQSLENLNSEIRGIWEVLKQSSGPGTVQLPPPPLAWPAVRTNPTPSFLSLRPPTQPTKTQVSGVGHVTTVLDTSLADRTRSLRDWLKSTRRSPGLVDQSISNQVTL